MRSLLDNSNIKLNVETFNSNIDKTGNCWNWIASQGKDGYGYFTILINNKKVSKKSHRISFALHNKRYDLLELPFKRSEVVMHLCNNKLCCNPKHLQLGTHKQNSSDALKQGLYKTGEQHKSHKLTTQQVQLIRAVKMPHSYYADLFSVSKSLVQKIALGVARKHG